MAIQQMALMAYKAPPAGGDSAFLQAGRFDGGITDTVSAEVIFNRDTEPTGNVDYVGSQTNQTYVWKTGPNAYTSYKAKFIRTFQSGVNDVTGSAVNTAIDMAVNIPTWTLLASGTTSQVSGYLVVLDSTGLIELANANITMITNTNV